MKGFLGSGALEAAIRVSFIYFQLAAFCSTVNEWISALLNVRANMLREALCELLGDQKLSDGSAFDSRFFGHPLISRPRLSWLPSRSFSVALFDLATAGVSGTICFETLESGLTAMPAGTLRTSLLALIQNAAGDLDRAESNIREWFNDSMTQASTRYKQRIHTWTAVIAAMITIGLNADTFSFLGAHSELPAGWSAAALNSGPAAWCARIAGWAITVAAVSLGAPFWFDTFRKVSGFRKPVP